MIDNGSLGEIYYYDSVRVNLGLFQQDVNVIWDLAVHDLAIMDYLLPERPCAVSATGISHIAGRQENIAYITMFFAKSMIAHIHVNWLSPVKVRSTLLSGSQKMIVYDDMEITEKVKVYDRGIYAERACPRRRNFIACWSVTGRETCGLRGWILRRPWRSRFNTSRNASRPARRRSPAREPVCRWCVFWKRPRESMKERGRLVELDVEKKATV